ncbi:MAG: toll/interleukin-1 receptor domain-containing protein [Saprospiraceae bacterium]|nr:toll/interleukin-1 receptor domain-containing protein [Saprospiraceae bacterium]MCB0625697.1 toll/interleukin-1 receptor domain-containing protein [Saprospiraceae bacterium]MCB0681265.1 toll/interleukin-1 receptor domain-containing protein [Saprospiraceae bacterium]
MSHTPEIFLSYAWDDAQSGGAREAIVDALCDVLRAKGYVVNRDKDKLRYKDNIKTFMQQIGRGRFVVTVISDKYLKSQYCMYELLELKRNLNFSERIFPIVLPDAAIYDPVDRAGYIQFWEQRKAELNERMQGLGQEHLQGLRDDIDLFDDIRDEIATITDLLRNLNTLSPQTLQANRFRELIDAIEGQLDEEAAEAGYTRGFRLRVPVGNYLEYTVDRVPQTTGFDRTIGQEQNRLHFFCIHGDKPHAHLGMFNRFVYELKGGYAAINQALAGADERNLRVADKVVTFSSSDDFETYRKRFITRLFNEFGCEPDAHVPLEEQHLSHLIQKSRDFRRLGKDDKVAVMFQIESIKWKTFSPNLVDYFINVFCEEGRLPADSPSFYFFVSVIYLEKDCRFTSFLQRLTKSNWKSKIIDMLEGGNPRGKNYRWATLLDELNLFERAEVEEWFGRCIDAESSALADQKIQELLGPNDTYEMDTVIPRLRDFLNQLKQSEL